MNNNAPAFVANWDVSSLSHLHIPEGFISDSMIYYYVDSEWKGFIDLDGYYNTGMSTKRDASEGCLTIQYMQVFQQSILCYHDCHFLISS